MQPAIGLVETNSIATGILAGDAMMKKAPVELLDARSVCPGKYIVLIRGLTDPVKESLAAGIEAGADTVVDTLFLPNVHLSVFPAMAGAVEFREGEAWGIIETISVACCIVAADAAAKAANITLMELRLANGLGGKSFVTLCGAIPDVEAAMAAGVEKVKEQGLLVRSVVIPRLHEEMRDKVL